MGSCRRGTAGGVEPHGSQSQGRACSPGLGVTCRMLSFLLDLACALRSRRRLP